MPKPEVLDIHTSFIPENSNALTAARVRLGNGALTIIEMFGDARIGSFDFRGIPDHLDGDFEIHVRQRLKDSTGTDFTPDQIEAIENRIMFEFSIGARQRLWDGAEAQYRDETCDPEDPLYTLAY